MGLPPKKLARYVALENLRTDAWRTSDAPRETLDILLEKGLINKSRVATRAQTLKAMRSKEFSRKVNHIGSKLGIPGITEMAKAQKGDIKIVDQYCLTEKGAKYRSLLRNNAGPLSRAVVKLFRRV